MKTIRVKIQPYADREKMTSALANNGYKVWVESDYNSSPYLPTQNFYVCFELPEVTPSHPIEEATK